MKLITAAIGFVLAGLIGCGAGHSAPPQNKLPTIYIIENGRTGWMKVVYSISDEKELPVQNGFAVARIGPDQKLFTRSRMNPSWDESQFYYETSDGKRVRLEAKDGPSRNVWGQEKTDDTSGQREFFFVGTQDQMSGTLRTPQTAGDGLLAPPKDAVKSASPEHDLINALPK